MDILKFSKRPFNLLTTDTALVSNSNTSDKLECYANKNIVEAPVSTLKPIPHPLQSDNSMRMTLERYMEMRRTLGGEPQCEKFIQELASAAQFNRGPPGASESSRLHYDMLLGRDDQIGYGDYFNKM